MEQSGTPVPNGRGGGRGSATRRGQAEAQPTVLALVSLAQMHAAANVVTQQQHATHVQLGRDASIP